MPNSDNQARNDDRLKFVVIFSTSRKWTKLCAIRPWSSCTQCARLGLGRVAHFEWIDLGPVAGFFCYGSIYHVQQTLVFITGKLLKSNFKCRKPCINTTFLSKAIIKRMNMYQFQHKYICIYKYFSSLLLLLFVKISNQAKI